MNKKAQVWFIDFMIGILIFVIVIFIYYGYAHNINQNPGEITSDLILDAKAISSSLITQGSPPNWNQSNVEIIGLTNGKQRIVQEKLDLLANITYSEARNKLRTPYNFYLQLKHLNGTVIPINSQPGFGQTPSDTENLASLTRVVVYNSKLTNLVIQVWE